jgi:hypothetical protein
LGGIDGGWVVFGFCFLLIGFRFDGFVGGFGGAGNDCVAVNCPFSFLQTIPFLQLSILHDAICIFLFYI